MNPYFGNIEGITEQNTNFRQVLFTGQFCQLVAMSLKLGEEIGAEVHDKVDQFFRVEEGQGKVVVGEGEEHMVSAGDAIIIPAGTKHNVINVSTTEDLKLYTIYSPPNHPDGTVHATKAEADAAEAAHHGVQPAEEVSPATSANAPVVNPVTPPAEAGTNEADSGGPSPVTAVPNPLPEVQDQTGQF